MILNKGGPKRKTMNGSAQPPFEAPSAPIANSTVMGQSMNMTANNVYLNETDQFFNDPFAQQQTPFHNNNNNNYYKPNQPIQPNGFYDMQSAQGTNYQQQPIYNPPQFQPNQAQPQQNMFFNPMQPNAFLNDPVASMAMKYGTTLADQGKEYVSQNVDKWFSISKLKYYFAVDTNYVAKKLLIILFPFINRDWSVKYSQGDVAVPPKLDVNAPDMYIPVMAFVTYILMVGIYLGTQEKFSPEKLGIQASSALGWFIIEVFLIFLSLQILNIKSALKTFDIMAFCGYKYFGMILCLAGSLMIPGNGYYFVLIYMCLTITYFMVRSLKLLILASNTNVQNMENTNNNGANPNMYENSSHGNKRRIYVLLFISLLQPLFMWWLTYRI